MDVRAQILVDAPVEVAFSHYCDYETLHEWAVGGGILEFTPTTPPPKQPGSRYRMVYRCLGITFRCLVEITILDPCRLSAKELVSGDYKAYRYEMHFSPIDANSTRMEMRVHALFPWGPVGVLVGWMGRPFVQRDIEAGLRRFKAGAEARAQRGGQDTIRATVP